jgi:hypothetical protein
MRLKDGQHLTMLLDNVAGRLIETDLRHRRPEGHRGAAALKRPSS